MSTLLLKSGRILDPGSNLDLAGDVLIDKAAGTILVTSA